LNQKVAREKTFLKSIWWLVYPLVS
jgi:hypothetical protein